MPYHLLLDHAGEAQLGKLQIGTTRRGIGPCYADKAARLGIRVAGPARREDPQEEDHRRARAQAPLAAPVRARPRARPAGDDRAVPRPTATSSSATSPTRAGCVWDLLGGRPHRALRGRPGRDARHRPRHLSVRHLVEPDRRRGLHRRRASARATSTRSGASPRPTRPASAPGRSRPSSSDELGDELREAGGEYGTTTGRSRRMGWLDLVALRYAARLNGLTALALTKLDVLSGLDRLLLCTSYRSAEGATLDGFPFHQTVLHHADGALRVDARLDGGPRRRAQRGRPAAARPATTSSSSPTTSGCRSS